MTTSLEDHAAMRLSGRLVVPLDCTCEEYAIVIVDQAMEIEKLKEKLRYYIESYLELLGGQCHGQSKR